MLVLRRCKANLLQRVVEKDVRDQSKEAKQLARMIAKVFPPLIEEDNEVMNEKNDSIAKIITSGIHDRQ